MPFAKGEMEEMSVISAYELCQKHQKELRDVGAKVEEARDFTDARQEFAKSNAPASMTPWDRTSGTTAD